MTDVEKAWLTLLFLILGCILAVAYKGGQRFDAISAECRARKGAPVVMVGGEFICVQPMPAVR
jgi:hypothetical protein